MFWWDRVFLIIQSSHLQELVSTPYSYFSQNSLNHLNHLPNILPLAKFNWISLRYYNTTGSKAALLRKWCTSVSSQFFFHLPLFLLHSRILCHCLLIRNFTFSGYSWYIFILQYVLRRLCFLQDTSMSTIAVEHSITGRCMFIENNVSTLLTTAA